MLGGSRYPIELQIETFEFPHLRSVGTRWPGAVKIENVDSNDLEALLRRLNLLDYVRSRFVILPYYSKKTFVCSDLLQTLGEISTASNDFSALYELEC